MKIQLTPAEVSQTVKLIEVLVPTLSLDILKNWLKDTSITGTLAIAKKLGPQETLQIALTIQ